MDGRGTDGFLHVKGDMKAGYTKDIDGKEKFFIEIYL